MNVFGITFGVLLQVLLSTCILGYSFGPDRCDVPTDTRAADCGYYGIKELECIQRGCCWKPCENCAPSTPWCVKSREMGRPECQQKPESKKDCGYYGIQREECLRKGCCWSPSDIPNDAWCYYESAVSVPTTVPPETEAPAIEEGKLRILGSEASGRLQIYLNGEWGTICDDMFNKDAVAIACRQLGFDATNAHILPIKEGDEEEGMGQILLDQVLCRGTEDNIMSCDHSAPGVHNCRHSEDVVISCEPYTQEIRLVGGSGDRGRLEVFYDGEWGTVCDDNFGEREARVACRQLGFPRMSRVELIKRPAGTDTAQGKIWLDEVQCTNNNDSIYDCYHRRWGQSDCIHSEDVFISCISESEVEESGSSELGSGNMESGEGSGVVTEEEGKLRILGSEASGRLQIYLGGEWGTICDDYFNKQAAVIACRQLGFDATNAHILPIREGDEEEGMGQILLDDVSCTGTEDNIMSCSHSAPGVHDCQHSEDVVISCEPYTQELRLVGGSGDRGRLEVFYDGEWGTVCDDNFGEREARVACRQLGFSRTSQVELITPSAGTDSAPGRIWLDEVGCEENNDSIYDCYHLRWGQNDCSHSEDVFISCIPESEVEGSGSSESGSGDVESGEESGSGDEESGEGDLRLVGPEAPVRGRLEVLHNGEWGTVCDDGFGRSSAAVACKQLGYANNFFAVMDGGEDVDDRGPIMLDSVICSGDEARLTQCSRDDWFSHDCSHYEDVHLDCDVHTQVRLRQNRLEVKWQGEWGTVCDDGFDVDDAKVVCRQLNLPHEGAKLLPVPNSPPGNVPSAIHMDEVECSEDVTNLQQCNFNGWGINDCSHSEDVYMECGESSSEDSESGSSESSESESGDSESGDSESGDSESGDSESGDSESMDFEVRLTQNRLEVSQNGTWGTVCDDSFDVDDARVACLHMNLPSEGAKILPRPDSPPGNVPENIFLDEVDCPQYATSMGQCLSNRWGVHDCSHSEDIYMECAEASPENVTSSEVYQVTTETAQITTETAQATTETAQVTTETAQVTTETAQVTTETAPEEYVSSVEGTIRLVGPLAPEKGRLEIFHQGEWGTVCDDSFSKAAATVACKQLGFSDTMAEITPPEMYDSATIGPILLDEVSCTGEEGNITNCKNNGWFNHDCSHTEDVHLDCDAKLEVRLNHNRLEVSKDGTWGTVCDDGFNITEAKTACRHMGLAPEGAKILPHKGTVPGELPPIVLDEVRCPEDAVNLLQCSNNGWGSNDCSHTEDIYLECGELTEENTEGDIRILGSGNSGRIQIYHDNQWGTVCDDEFDRNAAIVACRQLGFDGTSAHILSKKPGDLSALGQIMLDNVVCNGDEPNLSACQHNSWGENDCTHNEDVILGCEPFTQEIRLSGGENPGRGRLEIFYEGEWGTVCDDGFSDKEARVVCRQLGFTDMSQVEIGNDISGSTASLEKIWLDSVNCAEDGDNLYECQHSRWGMNDCSHNEDVIVHCTAARSLRREEWEDLERELRDMDDTAFL